MAFDTYVKIDGIPGESTSKGFEKQIEIMNFSLGVSNTHTIGSATGGGGSGRASFHSFSLMKKTDKTSPILFSECASGLHIKTIVVTMRKTGGKVPINFLVYTFTDCAIDSVQWSGSAGGDDSPTESVSFGYGKVEVQYTPQKADGSPDAAVMKMWDLAKNTGA
jgi:type VI secretion system secreted protein Hcp